jgi:hypothetical protein
MSALKNRPDLICYRFLYFSGLVHRKSRNRSFDRIYSKLTIAWIRYYTSGRFDLVLGISSLNIYFSTALSSLFLNAFILGAPTMSIREAVPHVGDSKREEMLSRRWVATQLFFVYNRGPWCWFMFQIPVILLESFMYCLQEVSKIIFGPVIWQLTWMLWSLLCSIRRMVHLVCSWIRSYSRRKRNNQLWKDRVTKAGSLVNQVTKSTWIGNRSWAYFSVPRLLFYYYFQAEALYSKNEDAW